MPIYKLEGKKKGGFQMYRVCINYKAADGKYTRLERRVAGHSAAVQLEAKLLTQISSLSNPQEMTFAALFDEYLSSREVRESTVAKCRTIARLHLLPYLGDLKLTNLLPPVLQDWKRKIREQGYAAQTCTNMYRTLAGCLNYAVRMGYIAENALNRVGNFKIPIEQQCVRVDFYTAEEFAAFIECARDEAVRVAKTGNLGWWDFYAFFMIAFFTGLRKGEIHALRWTDLEGSVLHVRRSINQKLKGSDRETAPKNRTSIRDIQMPACLIVALDEHKARWKQHHELFDDTFFVCGGTTPLRDTTLEVHNAKYARMAGLKKIRIHDFRHSHASLLANAGINIQEIARRLGHSDVKMTWGVYAHMYPTEEERALRILDAAASKSSISPSKK